MKRRISVIIPMYNVENYIASCLDSLVEQTIFKSLEIYVIDDGSTDRSVEIVEKYVANYDNMRLLFQHHLGPGAARNRGLSEATEEFVTFLDADDLVPADAYSKLLHELQIDPDVEFATGQVESFPNKQQFLWQEAYKRGRRVVTSILEAPELIHSGSACNKMFRRSAFDDYGLSFPEHAHFEDARVIIPVLLAAQKFAIIPETVYLYRKRDQASSIMDSLFTEEKNYWDYLDLIEQIRDVSLKLVHEKRRLAEQFNVRGFQGFLLRYDTVITKEDRIAFLTRAYNVFVDVPAWLIRRNTHNPRHAFSYGLLRAMGKRNEYDSITADTRLHLVPTKPQLGNLKMGEYDTLMRSSGFTVWVESATRVGKDMKIEGRISARGLPIAELPAIELELILGNRKFNAEWIRRIDRPSSYGSYSAFSATVPLRRWPSGEYFPRLSFREGDVVIQERMLKTMGFWRNSRSFAYSGNSYDFASNNKNQIGVQKTKIPRSFFSRSRSFWAGFKTSWQDDRFFACARLIRSLHRRVSRRHVWLIGERFDMAQDNSAHLFKYLHDNPLPHVLPLYVASADSEAYRDMAKFGRVLRHGSLRHKLAYVVARQHISAFDTDTYLKPKVWDKTRTVEHFIGKTDIKRIFLQHGVTFRGDGVRGLHRLASGYDVVLTVSESEREFFARELGYGTKAINLGFPRFDSLTPLNSGRPRKILFAPTWRADLVVPSYSDSNANSDYAAFTASHYYLSIMDFLQSSDLQNFLAENDCELYFLPHYEVRDFFSSQTESMERVHVASTAEHTFQEWLRMASIYITDYSSTSFDVAIMDTPVVYFGWDPVNPDTGQFYETSYFFYDRDGFGPVAYSPSEVVQYLNDIRANDFLMSDEYKQRIRQFYGDLRAGNITRQVVNSLAMLR